MSADGPPRRRIRTPEDANWPPSIKILRAATGAHSPRTDERCLTYCTQTAAGRTAGRAPVCRSLCLRHVFLHELTKLTKPRTGSSLARAFDGAEDDAPPELDAIPLPAEGQRPGAFFAPLWPPFAASLRGDAPDEPRRAGPTSAADALRAAGKAVDADELAFGDDDDDAPPEKEAPGPPRAWAPGTYVWATRSKWHALDHLNMMMFSLRAQAGWDAYRARMRTEADAQAHAALLAAARGRPPPKAEEGTVYEDATVPREDEFHPGMANRRTRRVGASAAIPQYPEIEGQSLLVPLPPPLPSLRPAMERLLSPAGRMLSLTAQAWEDGAYVDLGKRCYEKAFGDGWREPWRLLAKAWTSVRRTKDGSNDDE